MGRMKELFISETEGFHDYLTKIGIEVSFDEVEDVYYSCTFSAEVYGPCKEGLVYLANRYMDKEANQVTDAMKKVILSSNMVDSNTETKLDIKYVKKNGDIEEFVIKVLDIEEDVCYAINCNAGMAESFHIDRITEVKEHDENARQDTV